MRISVCLLSLALTSIAPAQDPVIAELRELALTKRPVEEWKARDAAIATWIEKNVDRDLGDHRFVLGVARYFTKDYDGSAQVLLAEIDRLGALPTADFDTIVGRSLMSDMVRAVRAADFERARADMPAAARYYDDPGMVYRTAVSAGLRAESAPGVAFADAALAAMFDDDRLDAEARQKLLKALYVPSAAPKVAGAGRGSLKPFTARDMDGQEIDLAKMKGKVVLVDFWATWCGPCIREMPNVVAAHKAHREQGFEVIGISLDQEPGQKRGGPLVAPDAEGATTQKIRDAATRLGMDWPIVYEGGGWETRLAKENGIGSIPATFLIDKKGQVRFTNLRGEELAKRVAELLAED
ncbi:MAG: TlpA disulfide reductase family protein [Planctomycetota bacterium]|nr:TlpA disulfide reductase family protein [Planctomycetota bacterium]